MTDGLYPRTTAFLENLCASDLIKNFRNLKNLNVCYNHPLLIRILGQIISAFTVSSNIK
jgi:hypothetical protein